MVDLRGQACVVRALVVRDFHIKRVGRKARLTPARLRELSPDTRNVIKSQTLRTKRGDFAERQSNSSHTLVCIFGDSKTND